jgi:hypothetical protein
MALARIACRSAAVCALPTSIGSRRTKMLDIVFTGPDASFTRVPDRLVVLDAGGGLGEKELKGVCHKNSLNACASSGTRAAPSSIELTCHCACTYPSISGPPRQWAMRPLHVHTRPVAFESYQCDVEATLFGWMQHHQRNALKLMASAPVWPLHTQWPSAHRSGHCTHTHTHTHWSSSHALARCCLPSRGAGFWKPGHVQVPSSPRGDDIGVGILWRIVLGPHRPRRLAWISSRLSVRDSARGFEAQLSHAPRRYRQAATRAPRWNQAHARCGCRCRRS